MVEEDSIKLKCRRMSNNNVIGANNDSTVFVQVLCMSIWKEARNTPPELTDPFTDILLSRNYPRVNEQVLHISGGNSALTRGVF